MLAEAEVPPAENEEAAPWRRPPVLALLGVAFLAALASGWVGAARLKTPEAGAGPRARLSGGGALPVLHAALESASQSGQEAASLETERQAAQTALTTLQKSLAEETGKVEGLKQELAALAQAPADTAADPALRKRLAGAKLAMLEKLSAAAEALVAARHSAAGMGGLGEDGPLPFDGQSLAAWKKDWAAITAETASQIRTAQAAMAALKEMQAEWTAWNQQAGNGEIFPRLEEAKSRLTELDSALAQARESQPEAADRLDKSLQETEKRLDDALARLEKSAAPAP